MSEQAGYLPGGMTVSWPTDTTAEELAAVIDSLFPAAPELAGRITGRGLRCYAIVFGSRNKVIMPAVPTFASVERRRRGGSL